MIFQSNAPKVYSLILTFFRVNEYWVILKRWKEMQPGMLATGGI
jgi:hypothetical protein